MILNVWCLQSVISVNAFAFFVTMPNLNIIAWECIGTPQNVLNWIEEGVTLQFASEP